MPPVPTLYGAPLVPDVTGGTIIPFAGAAMGDIHSVLTTTLVREGYYQANAGNPNVVPSPEILFGLYQARRLAEPNLRAMLSYNGVRLPPSLESTGQQSVAHVWNQHLANCGRKLDPDTVLRFMRRGVFNRNDAETMMNDLGFGRNTDMRDWFLDQWEQLPVEVLLRMLLNRNLTDAQFNTRAAEIGLRPADAALLRGSLYQPLGVGDALALWQRGALPEADMRAQLERNGVIGVTEQDGVIRLANQTPGPSDLVYLCVKEAFDNAVAAANEYDAEFPPEFARFMGHHGLNWSPTAGTAGGDDSLTWARMYWRAHWRPVSPEQAYRMHQRLRGDPEDAQTWRVPGVHPYTTEMLRTALKINDFSPAVRDALEAISYNPLRLVDIRAALRLRLPGKDRDWAIEQFQDRGHTLADSETQADIAVAMANATNDREQEQNTKSAERRYVAAVIRSYKSGILTRDLATERLTARHHTADTAALKLNAADLESAEEQVEAAIRRSRSDFMGGRDTEPNLRLRLVRAGIGQDAADRLLRLWGIQRGEGKRLASTDRIIRWLRRGFINPAEATRRLNNLGWSQADMFLLGQELMYDVSQEQAKIQAALGKAQATAAKEVQRAIEAQQKSIKDSQAELRRLTPPAKLLKWYESGILARGGYVSRMTAMGYPAAVITLNLAEADQRIAAGKAKP